MGWPTCDSKTASSLGSNHRNNGAEEDEKNEDTTIRFNISPMLCSRFLAAVENELERTYKDSQIKETTSWMVFLGVLLWMVTKSISHLVSDDSAV